MKSESDFLGQGFAFPMRVSPSGGIAWSTGPDGIGDSLLCVLGTSPGERVMRPSFGCAIWDQLFEPINPNDDQFLMIVDMKTPNRPREVGRWWLPGTRKGDAAPPVPRLKIDSGYRMHTLVVDPERPSRAYVGWIDGGVVILDIADKSRPTLVGQTVSSPRSW